MDVSDKEAIDEIMVNFSILEQHLKDQGMVILKLLSSFTLGLLRKQNRVKTQKEDCSSGYETN